MIWRSTPRTSPRIGLVLPGGGARAAYQVGVLRAIARMVPKDAPTPFQVITGTSAGSINATALAINADHFRRGVLRISRVWKDFEVEQVFRADTPGVVRTGAHWLAALALGGLGRWNPNALLDRSPLEPLLRESLACERIQAAIDGGWLHALGVTASSYRTGYSVTFYQAQESVRPWGRERRIGIPEPITIPHLLASSAIPFIFSATPLHGEFYGDGSVRQIAPLSPALHLGADRILVVGIRRRLPAPGPSGVDTYPSLAQIAGHVLDSVFLDNLDTDLERLRRINRTISLIPGRRLVRGGIELRPIEALTVTPSRDLDEIAERHAHRLPRALRYLLRGVGVSRGRGTALLSYLLFDKAYCRELMALGYEDAMRKRDRIRRLLAVRGEA